MPRKKIVRTPEDEAEYQRARRERINENQRLRRQANRQRIIDQSRNISQTRELEIDRQTNQQRIINHSRNILQTRALETEQVVEDYLGEMNAICEHKHCRAKHFQCEKIINRGLSFNECCSHGSVKLDPLPSFPPDLLKFFDGTNHKSNLFFQNIRTYNNSLSFASFNANLVNFQSLRPGPYCFKIHGQVYYQINTALYPSLDEYPSYGQLFIIDPDEAVGYRMKQSSYMDHEIISTLDKVIREHNIFSQSYEMMQKEIENQRLQNNDEELPELQLLFTLKPGMDKRRFNFQRTNEVAAIFSTTADGEIPESYVTIRNKNTKTLQYVSSMDPNVEAWIYPLFYPYGSPGWHRDLKRIGNRKYTRVSRAAYTKYRIAIRDKEFNGFLHGRRLFQQWMVDSYVKVEKDRIQYDIDHQKEIKADSYKGLHDHLQNAANDIDGRVGKTVILPSSFIGSPRYMQEAYQDSMALVNEYGKPDIFLTMTCNPNWREIKENLLPNQQACDRPDLVARVFERKKDRLIDLIVTQKFFGEVQFYVYVIEFQKRGLPHMHLLITLANGYKLSTPELIDKFISAELPDVTLNPVLHGIITANMIHGPCGDWCMVDGKCSKKYPKAFQAETTMDENGYPHYRRRDDGVTYEQSNGRIVNNTWIVPHNRILSQKFNCHINVEVVSSIQSVKYLYKYVYKGHDAASVTIGQKSNDKIINHDEAQHYIETRYVGPTEAAWRILSKPLQGKSHHVIKLPVHLPNEQTVIITDENINNLNQSSSKLLDYFKLNIEDPDAPQYLYKDLPRYYTHKKQKIDGVVTSWWAKRQQKKCIGRMYSVSPSNTELFHLRLLLLNKKGATSFQSLLTVDNVIQPTFTAACLALGLIETDDEWAKAMNEATLWMMPSRLRQLFVRILIHCQPVYPEKLWEEFKGAMSEDFSRHHDSNLSYQMAYAHVNSILINEGRSLSDFPTMEQTVPIAFPSHEHQLSLEELLKKGQSQYNQLNNQQKEIVDIILNAARNSLYNSHCLYIDGPGGSGKTFIYTTVYYLLTAEKIQVSTMAFTGIAATLLPKGKTVHKMFGLPVPLLNDSSSNVKAQSKEGEILKNTKVFIWDEAPMAPRYALEIVNRTLQHVMGNKEPFGGKIMILGGDFRQLLPILRHGTRSENINLSIKCSRLWNLFTKYSLTKNMRALPNEISFAKFLLDVGDGNLNDDDDNINIPEKCILETDDNIVQKVFGQLIRQQNFNEMNKRAILAARHVDVDNINLQVTRLLDQNTERVYIGIDSTENCDNGDLDEILLPEYLNTLCPPNFPPHELRLRKNCIVMLVRNISINEGLCNGTRLQILDFSDHLLKCKILTGDKLGEIIFLNRISLYCENEYPFKFKRRQFPIKIAFAMTINKAQGQTFDYIGINLERDVFNHGQLYVAMSRVRSWDSLKIYLGQSNRNNHVKNYVYKELYN